MFRRELMIRVAIFLLAFTVRFGINLKDKLYLNVDSAEIAHVSQSLAFHSAYADPFEIMPTGPTAHVMPATPLLRSAILRIMGDGVPGTLVRQAISTAVTSASYALLPYAAVSLGVPVEAGLIAAILGAALPLQPYTELSGEWDNPYAGTFLLLLTAFVARRMRKGHLPASAAWKFGLLAGFGLLLSASLVPVFAGLLLLMSGHYLLVGHNRQRVAACLRFCAIVVCLCLTILFPWALRNRLALGSWVWLRDNFGLELWVSNNPLAAPDWNANYTAAYPVIHPNVNRQEALNLIQVGEVRYSQSLQAKAVDWIRHDPKRFAGLTLQRMRLWWFPPGGRLSKTLLFAAITVVAFLGLALFMGRNPRSAAIIACIWLLYPLTYYFIQFIYRYRYPMEWSLWLMVGLFVHTLLARLHPRALVPIVLITNCSSAHNTVV